MNKIVSIIFLLCSLSFTGCLDDDGTQFLFERIPIESVDIPDTFERGKTATIVISYFRKSNCHSFHSFDYRIEQNQRTVSVIDVIIENESTCVSLDKTDTVDETLEFSVGNEASYVFRFWAGLDDEDQDQFLEFEIPVEE